MLSGAVMRISCLAVKESEAEQKDAQSWASFAASVFAFAHKQRIKRNPVKRGVISDYLAMHTHNVFEWFMCMAKNHFQFKLNTTK